MIIVLVGYMGSGKSLIGKTLAEKINFDFKDLDHEIELTENQKISLIFQNKGEIYFRKKEIEVLKEQLKASSNTVLALGGGTPCYGNNLEWIKNNPNTMMVYLKMNLNSLTERLFAEKDHRPLIQNTRTKEDLNDFIRKHLFERQYYYMQSDYRIDVSERSPESIVEEIVGLLQEQNKI